jgi:hypothetical protein
MTVPGVLTCEVVELEFAHLLSTDGDIGRLTLLDDGRSARLLSALQSPTDGHVRRISVLEEFAPDRGCEPEVLAGELGLHVWPTKLREALV